MSKYSFYDLLEHYMERELIKEENRKSVELAIMVEAGANVREMGVMTKEIHANRFHSEYVSIIAEIASAGRCSFCESPAVELLLSFVSPTGLLLLFCHVTNFNILGEKLLYIFCGLVIHHIYLWLINIALIAPADAMVIDFGVKNRVVAL